ncbi:MAG TPA: T9SS type A sorting domain-containing protein [Bacteroidia bacterium]|nr:T9SS type A sorting domain-containing protein [Bacteroidia bacterium]
MKYVFRIAFLTAISALFTGSSAYSITWYSIASGNAETDPIWSLTTVGPGSTAATLGGFSTAVDVVVQPGTVVDVYSFGSFDINNLQVDAGGQFYSTNAVNRYVNVYGSIICNGIIGNPGIYNSICFNFEGSSSTISGAGTFEASRLRKNGNANTTTDLTIGMDVNLRWTSGTSTQIYNNAFNTRFNVTVNAGATIKLIAGSLSIDGTAGNGIADMSGTVTVNGTLVVSNTIYLLNNNTGAGHSTGLVIGATGVVKTNQLNAGASTAGGHSLVVQAGGKLELTGLPAISPFSLVNATYSCLPGSVVEYSAAGAQTLESGITYGNLVVSGSGNKSVNGNLTLENSMTINGSAVLISNSNTISLKGDWVNWGSGGFTEAASKVVFNGTSPQQITTAGVENFYDTEISNSSSSGVTLNTDIAVAGNLNLLNSGRLTFGSVARTVSLTNNANVPGISGTPGSVIDMSGGAAHLLQIAAWNSSYTGNLSGGAGTVEYNGTNNGSGLSQVIVTGAGMGYNNLLLTGSGPKSMDGNITLSGWYAEDGATVELLPLNAVRNLTVAGDFVLSNGASMNNSCLTLLNLLTSGNGNQIVNGNNAQIKAHDFTTVKNGGSVTLAGPSPITGFNIYRDLNIFFNGGAVFHDGGNQIQIGDDAELGAAGALPGNFDLTGTLFFTGLGGDGEIHISGQGGLTVTPAALNNLNVSAGAAAGLNSRLEMMPVGGGQSLVVKSDFIIGTNSYFDPNTNSLYAGGNWTSWSASGFIDPSTTVIFNGTSNQTITCPGGEGFMNVTINKPGGSLLLNNLIDVIGTFNFLNGVVYSTAANVVRFYSGSVVTNMSNLSYVNGPVRKSGSSNFTYPVGKGGFYRPVTLSGLPGPGIYLAEYFLADPHTVPLNVNSKDPTLDHISRCEYWNISRVSGTTANVSLTWNAATSCGVTLLNDLRVAGWDGGTWRDRGNGGTSGTIAAGTIVTSAVTAVFGPFTLSSVSAGQNPLPVEWLSFDAFKQEHSVELKWSTASEINSDYFEITRSNNGTDFQVIGSQKAAGNTATVSRYAFIDLYPQNGMNYYRLVQHDFDGGVTFSNVAVVKFTDELLQLQLFPNPVVDWLHIQLPYNYAGSQSAVVTVFDNSGKVTTLETSAFMNALTLDVKHLSRGIYFIRLSFADGRSLSSRFVKQ